MRHTSLDEGFWRSATEALVSGVPIQDVEPFPPDVPALLLRLHELAMLDQGSRLALLTLSHTEQERALALVLAALVARRGCRVLLVDLDFSDETWARLLGAEGPAGIAEHLAHGTTPEKLVLSTSWETLALLPGGAVALEGATLLRSEKLQACIAAAAAGYDLTLLGFPFDESLDWGRGATAGIEQAILIGPAGDELAFELAIPKLVSHVEILATLDAVPLGRWRSALGAALPVLVPPGAPAKTRQALTMARDARIGGAPSGPVPAAQAPAERGSPGGRAALVRERGESPYDAERQRSGSEPADAEAAADVAFLSRLSSEHVEGSATPQPGLHPKLRLSSRERLELTSPAPARELRELASAWREGEDDAAEESEAGDDVAPRRRRRRSRDGSLWKTALAALVLCLLLGAGAFWYWRSRQQIPDGEFTFVEADVMGEETAAGAVAGRREPAGELAEESTPEAAKESRRSGDAEAARASEPASAARTEPDGGAATGAAPADGPAARVERAEDVAAARGEAAADREKPEPDAEAPPAQPPDSRTRDAAPEADESRDASVDGGFAPPQEGPVLGFSLHVGSFQTYEGARRAAAELEAAGRTAFVVPVLLEEKGRWYRVFTGVMADAPQSMEQLARAKEEGVVQEGTVRETPWALYLGTFDSREQAAEVAARLDRSGISAYAVGEDPVLLYAGAFESAADAELLNRELRDRGFEAALVRRRTTGGGR